MQGATSPPAAVAMVELPIRGQWFARPIADAEAAWLLVQELPGTVAVSAGEAYQLKVAPDVQDEELDRTAQQLRNLTSLWSLDLSRCERVTDSGLAHLAHLISLQSLNLFGCERVTNRGLAHLWSLSSLQSLRLTCCAVTDDGMKHLGSLTSLRSLEMSWCKVTDEGLAHLRSLISLQKLSLYGCAQVTDSGVIALSRALPACKIFR